MVETEQLRLYGVGRTLKVKKKRCYVTWKKHIGITTIHRQRYKDCNGKILKATEVTKMYQDYLSL